MQFSRFLQHTYINLLQRLNRKQRENDIIDNSLDCLCSNRLFNKLFQDFHGQLKLGPYRKFNYLPALPVTAISRDLSPDDEMSWSIFSK